jgi:predicted Holliday junction resolvase-like endonuclease
MEKLLGSIGMGSMGNMLLVLLVFLILLSSILFILWTIVPFVIFGIRGLLKQVVSEQKEIVKHLKTINRIEKKLDLLLSSESRCRPNIQESGEPNDFENKED